MLSDHCLQVKIDTCYNYGSYHAMLFLVLPTQVDECGSDSAGYRTVWMQLFMCVGWLPPSELSVKNQLSRFPSCDDKIIVSLKQSIDLHTHQAGLHQGFQRLCQECTLVVG